MSERPGCLFGLPARLLGVVRGRRAIAARALPARSRTPHPNEQDAVRRGRAATRRCLDALHSRDSVGADVLDQVGTSLQALGDSIETLADRLARARAWLADHDAEALQQAAAELELETGGGLAAERARAEELASITRTLAKSGEVERGLPVLQARLSATVRALEALVGRVTSVPVDGLTGADGLVGQTRRQLTETEQALAAWRATEAELEGL